MRELNEQADQAASNSRLVRLRGSLSALAAGAVAWAVVALVDPNEPGHYPTCPFFALTGHFCPGCGSLRAMHALAHGDVVTAAGFNVLTLASLPVLAVIWLKFWRRSWNGTSRSRPAPAAWLWAFLAVVVVFTLVRNLPFGAALAP
jgi:drug/metabolite transporter (DMT)-like permease